MLSDTYLKKGWCHFPYDESLAAWVDASLPSALSTINAPENEKWIRCGSTWFAGVNALPNDEHGAIDGGPPLQSASINFINTVHDFDQIRWDRAQVSVCSPGFPKRGPDETEGALRYRRNFDSAHIDGLLPIGAERRRHMKEHHAFVLGVPMVEYSAAAAPFVVWEESHHLVRKFFIDRFSDLPRDQWADIDVTDDYQALRRTIFETCKRVEVAANPGESYLVHRFALHGMAPWAEDATAQHDMRIICYFRPDLLEPENWLRAP